MFKYLQTITEKIKHFVYRNKIQIKKIIKSIEIFIAILSFLFVVLQHGGFVDRYFLHTDLLNGVANNLSTSYAPNQRVYRTGDKEWKTLIKIIYKYSSANFPQDQSPKILARAVAISSAKQDLGNGEMAEWTAPTTPIYLIFKDWPVEGVYPEDYRIIGTVQDLQNWIVRYREDFNFKVNNMLIGSLSLIIALGAFFIEIKN